MIHIFIIFNLSHILYWFRHQRALFTLSDKEVYLLSKLGFDLNPPPPKKKKKRGLGLGDSDANSAMQ